VLPNKRRNAKPGDQPRKLSESQNVELKMSSNNLGSRPNLSFLIIHLGNVPTIKDSDGCQYDRLLSSISEASSVENIDKAIKWWLCYEQEVSAICRAFISDRTVRIIVFKQRFNFS
jgi:hypothetical protein